MDNFQLSGITFSVTANESNLKHRIDQLFGLCKKTTDNVDIEIDANIVHAEKLRSFVPQWLISELSCLNTSQGLVTMFFGPREEPVAVIITGKFISCAWQPWSREKINIVVFQKDKITSDKSTFLSDSKQDHSTKKFLALPKKNAPITSSIQSVLPPLLREVFLDRKKQLLMHSAALKCPCETGILLIADCGSGKTTTALSILRKGGKLLGDDLILLDVGEVDVRAIGFPEMMNLTDETISFFNELDNIQYSLLGSSGTHKKIISPLDVYGNRCMIESYDINVIYFINVSGDAPSVKKLLFSEAIGKLMHSQTFANKQKLNEFVFSKLSDVFSQINAYELKTGNRPEFIGEWLIQHCAAHAKDNHQAE